MSMENEGTYTIKAVSNRTGLSTHVIRAWEKRYNAIEPKRTPTNRRVYTQEEVDRLRMLKQATDFGHSIGNIATLSADDLKALVAEHENNNRVNWSSETRSFGVMSQEEFLETSLNAIGDLNALALETILIKMSVALSQPVLLEQMIVPLIQKVGDLWREGKIRVVHEHLASAVIRTFLGNLCASNELPQSAPKIIVTTPAGQLHELGALIVSVIANTEGWQVTYLGPNLPAEEIATAATNNHAKILGLSLVYPTEDPRLTQEFRKLKKYLPKDTLILVGGRAALSYKSVLDSIGAKIVTNLQQLRTTLESLCV